MRKPNWHTVMWIVIFMLAFMLIIAESQRRIQQEENTRLKTGMVQLDSLLTIYQTQLTACRADREELGEAVVGLFNALPREVKP